VHTGRYGTNRRTRRAFALVVAAGFTVGLVLTGWRTIDDARGATVGAEIVGITTNAPGRRVYDVRFVTAAGRSCESRVDSGSNPPHREIHVGGRARVHYPASNPCDGLYVRETTSSSPWWLLIFQSVAIAACLVAVWRLRPSRDRG
jgi:hypothetical protein